MFQLFLKLHRILTRFDAAISRQGWALLGLLLRVFVGWQFLHSGLLKLANWEGTLELFRDEYHVPLLSPDLAAYLGTAGELALPIFLFVGLFSRPAALALFFVNLMAVVSYPALWMFDCPAAITDHLYWGLILVILTVNGVGRASLDHFLTQRMVSLRR